MIATHTLCPTCESQIQLVPQASGQLVQLDMKPHFAGTVIIEDGTARELYRAELNQIVLGRELYSHHALTCAGRGRASGWRRFR